MVEDCRVSEAELSKLAELHPHRVWSAQKRGNLPAASQDGFGLHALLRALGACIVKINQQSAEIARLSRRTDRLRDKDDRLKQLKIEKAEREREQDLGAWVLRSEHEQAVSMIAQTLKDTSAALVDQIELRLAPACRDQKVMESARVEYHEMVAKALERL